MFTLGYIIESQLCVVVLYLFYMAFLHNRIAHKASRAYLLTMLPVALLVPLVNLPILPAPIIQMYEADIDTAQTVEVVTTTAVGISNLLWVYIVGVVAMFAWLIIGIVMLAVQLNKSRFESRNGMEIVFTDRQMSAYSVFNYVFVNAAFRGSQYIDSLLVHEECHIRQRHTLDLIYMSLLRAALWFNPAVWHIGVLLRQVHEYQADEEVINQGYSTHNYINLLILSEASISPEFASHLSYSLTKKRLTMLAKKQRVTSLKRLLLTLPVIAMLLIAFSVTTRAAIIIPATVSVHDSIQKEKPLILVDGVEWEKSMEDIDPATITSISVIKNREDIAKYGEKGKSGVILITLKDFTQETDIVSLPDAHDVVGRDDESGPLNVAGYSNSNKALTIVDGKEVNIASIDPDNIARINVLKGDSAIEAYGERGKDGVVIITLKEVSDVNAPKKSEQNENVLSVAEIMPKFEDGGINNFQNWVARHIKYPEVALSEGVQSKVIVEFIIETDGTLGSIKVLKGTDKLLNEEVVRVLQLSPKWVPGSNKGVPVRVKFSIPVIFAYQ